ncbi:hypothetical protein WDZ16_01410 [Pseudokineococcus marinus]|uniref:Uncharacterized protein n=1 Tax=Pseudokineococcus marinus TaxID=351215 RepID=A0A849BPL8_9ACTN|nr:hypothetical protein [Pseudokineococcus marinus]NNH21496.1 hypothetical protein [Pseudokineococcus marinus]
MTTTGPARPRLRDRALGALTFFYGPADHRELPDDPRRTTGRVGEDVGDGLRRRGEPGRYYAQRDDDGAAR